MGWRPALIGMDFMKRIQIQLAAGERLFQEVRVAEDFGSRFFGMMFWRRGRDLPALWFPDCNSIHMFFMRIPLDLIFLNSKFEIVKIALNVKPWTPYAGCSKARSVLEVVPGTWDTSQIKIGDTLVLKDLTEI